MPMLMLMCSAVLPCAAAPEAGAATAVDAGWILQQLAQSAPPRTAFVELRGSPLLKAPLRIEGEYQRPDAQTLVREVRAPYAETTTLREGQARIARAGKPVRSFALARAPELAQLQTSFGALLAGDRKTLEQHYRLAAEGSRGQWTLRMVPLDAKLAASLRELTLHGKSTELRCIETQPVKGDLQRTLLGSAALSAAPDANGAALAALCINGSGS